MDELEKGWKTIYLIWIAMLVVLFLYMLVGLSLEDKIDLSLDKSVVSILRYIFYFLSGILVFSIKYVRNMILNSESKNEQNSYSENPAVFTYIKATITSLAMAEFVAVLGLVLFLISKNSLDLYLLIFISAVAMIFYRPFKEQMIEYARDYSETG